MTGVYMPPRADFSVTARTFPARTVVNLRTAKARLALIFPHRYWHSPTKSSNEMTFVIGPSQTIDLYIAHGRFRDAKRTTRLYVRGPHPQARLNSSDLGS